MTKAEIADRLKHFRTLKGMTQSEVSHAIERKQQTIASWEIGQSQPDISTLIQLCDLYEITLEQFRGEENANKKDDNCIAVDFDELEIIKKYKAVPDDVKNRIKDFVEFEYLKTITSASVEIKRNTIS